MSLSDRAVGMVESLSAFEDWRIRYALTEHPGSWDYFLGPLRENEVPSDRLRKTLMCEDFIQHCEAHRITQQAVAEEDAAYRDSK
jgi:hypothetical protein